MLASFLQKSRLAHMEAVVLAAQERAGSDRAAAQRMAFALLAIKAGSCLESGRLAEEAEKKSCVQLAQALTPEAADHIGMLFIGHAGELQKQGKEIENLACGLVAAGYVAHSLGAFTKVSDRAERLMALVDAVEFKVRAISNPIDGTGSMKTDSVLDRPLGLWLEASAQSQALLATIRQLASEHLCVDPPKPAYMRSTNDSLANIWRDTRIEALAHLWKFGRKSMPRSEPALLASEPEQLKMLSVLSTFDSDPEIRKEHGIKYTQTAWAISSVYGYLERARWRNGCTDGSAELDFREFAKAAAVLQEKWRGFEQAKAALLDGQTNEWPEMPPFLVQLLFDDVTAKAKTVALANVWTAQWESSYELFEANLRDELTEQGLSSEDVETRMIRVRQAWRRLVRARDPDELTAIECEPELAAREG